MHNSKSLIIPKGLIVVSLRHSCKEGDLSIAHIPSSNQVIILKTQVLHLISIFMFFYNMHDLTRANSDQGVRI